jgi:mannose-6-phosphate isomerase
VNAHDLFYVPAGTLHALGRGLVVLEVQQASDTVYRLYDYNRKQNDASRSLNIREAIENISIPFEKPNMFSKNDELITSPFFSLYEINNNGTHSYDFSYAR